MKPEHVYRPRFGKVIAGLLVLGAGVVLLMRQLGTVFPEWLFTLARIADPCRILYRCQTCFPPCRLAGTCIHRRSFLFEKIYPGVTLSQFIIPSLVILVGAWIIFARRHHHNHWKHEWKDEWKAELKTELKEGQEQWQERMER